MYTGGESRTYVISCIFCIITLEFYGTNSTFGNYFISIDEHIQSHPYSIILYILQLWIVVVMKTPVDSVSE